METIFVYKDDKKVLINKIDFDLWKSNGYSEKKQSVKKAEKVEVEERPRRKAKEKK